MFLAAAISLVLLLIGAGSVLAVLSSPGARARVTNSAFYAQLASLPLLDRLLVRPLLNKRLVTGILVTGTPAEPVLYVTSSDPRISGGLDGGKSRSDTNSGIISRLTRTESGWKRLDLVRGLPRSRHDHATNGMALDPRSRTLYVAQGSNTNMGAPSRPFLDLPDYALSGAILAVDLDAIGDRTYDLPTLEGSDGDDPFGGRGGQNQAMLVPDGPVQLRGRGFRNPYDVVLTRQGRLYSIDNGANAGWGDVPGPACDDESQPGGSDVVDSLRLVTEEGRYAGHPNPTRGNPGRFEQAGMRPPVPAANPVECRFRPPTTANGALATFSSSTNGLTEYRAANLGGALAGDLLTVSFDGSLYRVQLDDSGERVTGKSALFKRAAAVPLDVTALGDEDVFPGTLWVADWASGEIAVYEPNDFATGTLWEDRAPSGRKRQEVSYVRAGDQFYLAGAGALHEAYDPAADSWRKVAPLPADLDHIQGVAVGGKIYYVGGLEAWPKPAAASVFVYDPATDSFSRGTPMPRPRGAGGVAVHGGKVYYAGGLRDGRAVAWFDVYDPATRVWRTLPDMPRARDHFQAAVVGGRFYAIGGRDTDIGAVTRANDAFDFSSGAWSTGLAPLPTARGGFATALVGDEILVVGGEGGGRAFSTVEAYDTGTDTWRTLPPLRVPRHGIQAVACAGSVYVAAGGGAEGGGEPTAAHEVLHVAGARCGLESRAPERGDSPPVDERSFRRSVLAGPGSENPTSLQFGPDGRLYVADQHGLIRVHTIVRRDDGSYEATETETIRSIQSIENHDDDGRPAARLLP